MDTQLSPKLVLSDSYGVYIPQIYCEDADEEWAESVGVDFKDVLVCQAGPDQDWYYEAWNNILDSAHKVIDGVTWRLVHDGDLFEVPDTHTWPEY
jgi:hypothetical protein